MSFLLGFQKDSKNALVSGICAGLARGFNVERKWVRIAALILLFFATVPTVILYILAAVLLPPKSKWLD